MEREGFSRASVSERVRLQPSVCLNHVNRLLFRLTGLALGALVLAAGCSRHPTAPNPTPDPLAIACPASQTSQSATGQPLAVTYPSPVVTGGTQPVVSSCAPASGSTFPIGATVVTCSATDAAQKRDSCTFNVTIAAPPRISVTRFVAFGDSITEGLKSLGAVLLIPNPTGSYPFQLESMLVSRYTAQTPVVLDEGVGGETIQQGVIRLGAVLSGDALGALLLLEGANDLNAGGAGAIPTVISGLQTMVRDARARGLPVFLATLLPQRPGGSRAGAVSLIAPTNDQIRGLAAAEGAVLVDVYTAFGGSPDPGIGDDGLHPNTIGNQMIAQTFFDAIRARLEAQ